MNSEQLLRQVELVRAITLTAFDHLDEELADRQPAGFPNNIRWNLGHILITQEQLATHFAGMEPQLPPEYLRWFGNKTKPSDWTETTPTLQELKHRLQIQTAYICDKLGPRLDDPALKPFVRLGREMTTIGEVLTHSLYHEGLHQGAILGLRKAIAARNG
ncbi:DinB family protein [Paenibacillus chartarius]|uniref:DinB family protein n=1 Tax=Paenibacillus chartarius TaxID=747481 RepID=A0ABV6DVG4_9BACL